MEFIVKSITIGKQRSTCAVVGVFDGHRLSPSAQELDRLSNGYIVNILKGGDMKSAPGQTLCLYNVPRLNYDRVLLVRCGKEKELDAARFRKVLQGMASALAGIGLREAVSFLTEIEVKDRDLAWTLRQTVEVTHEALYRFDRLKSKKEDNGGAPQLHRLTLNIAEADGLTAARQAVRQGQAVANGIALAKDLGNLPGNICTPSYLADEARKLARGNAKLSVKILTEKEMTALKMGSLLSVARGSRQPPRLIVLSYHGTKRTEKPYVLVGKGITFDSGGISIKPAATMDEMKFDMCGAAAVLGTVVAAAEMALPLNVIAVVPSCENLPDGNASKPGDIVTSMSGQTIEILNTDAEGRLILCDALTYSERFKPRAVIDVATLTGACVVALGKQASGLFANDEDLAQELLRAGTSSGDRAWQMPLWDEYQESLKSNFADMANVGNRDGGAITAACFLSRYTKAYPWAHLDIAGTAWLSGGSKGATGRPIPLLTQYLIDQAQG
ncbi:MAG: leucyl aminopeptidase [Gammaproteobacteria bacterium]|nr:leucyl aminopeptidase [Gammaproteobacteria bacterium]